jgi:hypothetical protein
MYRISVTTIEKFRRYMTSASSFDTEEALIETIKGIFKGNDKTRTGEAFHKLIEGEFTSDEKHYYTQGIAFTKEQAQPAFGYKQQHLRMVHEVPVRRVYKVGEHTIQVSGRVDGLEGITVRDAKTKYRAIDWQEYMDSLQWRFYLNMLDLNVFYYDVFEVRGFGQLEPGGLIYLPGVTFLPAESLRCESYPDMYNDCIHWLQEFMNYIHFRNFYHLLKIVNETTFL